MQCVHRLVPILSAIVLIAQPTWSNAEAPDSEGLKRDTWYFLGYQWVTIGVLYMAPESVSGWTDEQKEGYSMSIWWDNVTHPHVDSDTFYINYVLHPYWGAAYFVRSRERGYNSRQAFWYSVMLSSAYEFGAEALFEEPSIQDLFVTPVCGSMLGQYFMRVRVSIRDREVELGHRSRKDQVVWVLTDPLGALNNKVDDWLGLESRLKIRPFTIRQRPVLNSTFEPREPYYEKVYGIEFRLDW